MIYFILDESSGFLKIGMANDPASRLALLQVGNPNRLELVGTLPGGRREELELHRRFAVFRGLGEWFRAEPDLLASIYRLLGVGSLHLNVWSECRRRNNCRAGLPGVQMLHVASGVRFGCRSTAWGADGHLMLYTEQPGAGWSSLPPRGVMTGSEVVRRMAASPPPLIFRAEDCVLESEWPVVCCHPAVPVTVN